MSRFGFTIAIVLLVFIGLGPLIILIKGHFLNRNDPPSISDQFHLATLAYEAEQYEDAYRIMYALAKAGDANAQFDLGFLYTWGRGCGKMMVKSSIGIGVLRNKETLKLN